MESRKKSYILKFAIFATGLSGIVAEYVFATLASYFMGDSTFQWAMIVSIMLFSMGLGSQISRYFRRGLLEKFIVIEFVLSIVSSFSSAIIYMAAGYSIYYGAVIYGLAILVGMLVGMEIPLVTRINEENETLRENISSVMAIDYFGSLIGGVFFAFYAIHNLGMTYTPFVVGGVNFVVALFMYVKLRGLVKGANIKIALAGAAVVVTVFIVVGVFFAREVILHGEQKRFKEKVVFEKRSKYQKVVITNYQNDYWLFINGNQQLSTLDEWMYHEPLVLPVMELSNGPKDILIMGGGDGCVAREVLKYKSVQNITLVDLDPVMTELGRTHPVLKGLNKGALDSPKVEIINRDGFSYLSDSKKHWDVIIIDLPDPKTLDISKLYSREFYSLCNLRLRPRGVMVTQAGTPQFAARAFYCIEKTMQEAGFGTVPLHNQIVTLGEWGYILAGKGRTKEQLLERLQAMKFSVETRWINNEAMSLLTSFGKPHVDIASLKTNTISAPMLHQYYLEGDWKHY